MEIYPNQIARERLARAATELGRSVEDLATSAVEEQALAWARQNGFPEEDRPHPAPKEAECPRCQRSNVTKCTKPNGYCLRCDDQTSYDYLK